MTNYQRDNTLTYQNAKERGYKWIDDIYPAYIDEDTEQFINQYGYKLGQAIVFLDKEISGLYAPLDKAKK